MSVFHVLKLNFNDFKKKKKINSHSSFFNEFLISWWMAEWRQRKHGIFLTLPCLYSLMEFTANSTCFNSSNNNNNCRDNSNSNISEGSNGNNQLIHRLSSEMIYLSPSLAFQRFSLLLHYVPYASSSLITLITNRFNRFIRSSIRLHFPAVRLCSIAVTGTWIYAGAISDQYAQSFDAEPWL